MIKTYGLTHIALAERDTERSLRFYRDVFGVREVFRDKSTIQVQTPGSRDVIAFDAAASEAGEMRRVAHFGFRLTDPRDIEPAVEAVRRAGGKILERGEFVPGEPYVYVADPDGYTIEIWYE